MRRGMTTRGRGMLAAATWGVLVLAGCTATAAETETDPTSETIAQTATPTPEAEPTPTPTAPPETIKPERPEAMNQADVAGAEATVLYFLALYEYVYATNDLEEWSALSHPECAFCASVHEDVVATAAAGETSVGGGFTIESAFTRVITPGTWFASDLTGSQDPWSVFDRDGNLLEEDTTSQPHTFVLAVVREDERWLVRAVQVDDAP